MRIGLKAALLGASMANSRFQYVKKFELADALLPDTYLVVRLDGHRFTRFTADHDFTKPNDERGLLLMTECARQVMSEWTDLAMAFGQSDEFSFLLPASSPLYGRRSAKISTSFVSLFSSSFVFFWSKYFPDTPLQYPPNFDARVVSYPTPQHIRDYFAWRQADCHINNLYNTCFWTLVADGASKQDAQVALKGTSSGDKNELLFSRFGINYNDIPQRFRKGTTLFRTRPTPEAVPEPPLPPCGSSTHDGGKDGHRAAETSASAEEGDATQMDGVPSGPVGLRSDAVSTRSKVESVATENGKGEDHVRNAEAGTNVVGEEDDVDKKKSAIDGGVSRAGSKRHGAGRRKKSLKKGHAPPGAIEEVTCDIIRDGFWDQNRHLLSGSTFG